MTSLMTRKTMMVMVKMVLTTKSTGRGGAFSLQPLQKDFSHLIFPPLLPVFPTGIVTIMMMMVVMLMILPTSTYHHYSHVVVFPPGKVVKNQNSNIVYYQLYQVSYYDKLLDACESAATKRGRTPFIREVGSQPVTVKFM